MDREPRYRHTQVGWVVLGALALTLAVIVPTLSSQGAPWIAWLVVALAAFVGSLFGTLTVRVGPERIELRFGIGLVRKNIALARVRSFRAVRNPWYYGWGVRLVPGGWMFNASGLSAVELVLRDGRRFRIGTDEPDRLVEALQRELGDPAPLGPDDPAPPSRKLAIALSVGLGSGVLAGVALLLVLESRPPRIIDGPTGLRIESLMYDDDVPDARIESVTLLDALPALRSRTNGFALGSLLRGSFELQDGSKARLYVDGDTPPFVEVRHAGGLLVFNAEDPARTRALYERLRERVASR